MWWLGGLGFRGLLGSRYLGLSISRFLEFSSFRIIESSSFRYFDFSRNRGFEVSNFPLLQHLAVFSCPEKEQTEAVVVEVWLAVIVDWL